MIKFITELFNKDPLIVIASIVALLSLILIIILSAYYKKLKEQQTLSEIISEQENVEIEEKPKTKDRQLKPTSVYSETKPTTQKISPQDSEIIIAQLKELSTQINSLNNYIKEVSSIIKSLQNLKLPETESAAPIKEETIAKLITALDKIINDLGSLQQISQISSNNITEISKKIDNLTTLLSTILQQ